MERASAAAPKLKAVLRNVANIVTPDCCSSGVSRSWTFVTSILSEGLQFRKQPESAK